MLDASCFPNWLLLTRFCYMHITSVQAFIIDIHRFLFRQILNEVQARFQRQNKKKMDPNIFFELDYFSSVITRRVCTASQDEAASGHTHRR